MPEFYSWPLTHRRDYRWTPDNPHNRDKTHDLAHGNARLGRSRLDENTVEDWPVKCDTMRQFSVAITWILLFAMCISQVWSASVVHRLASSHCQDAVTPSHVTACGYPPCQCDRQATASGGETAIDSPAETRLGCCVNQSPPPPDCPPNCRCCSDRNAPSLPVHTVSLRSTVKSTCLAISESRCSLDGRVNHVDWSACEPLPSLTSRLRCVSMCRLVL